MKKFLTVLLALSVVFTYTVGTAFAASGVQVSAKADKAYTAAEVESALNTVIDGYKSSLNGNISRVIASYTYDDEGFTKLASDTQVSKAAVNEAVPLFIAQLVKAMETARDAQVNSVGAGTFNEAQLTAAKEAVEDCVKLYGKADAKYSYEKKTITAAAQDVSSLFVAGTTPDTFVAAKGLAVKNTEYYTSDGGTEPDSSVTDLGAAGYYSFSGGTYTKCGATAGDGSVTYYKFTKKDNVVYGDDVTGAYEKKDTEYALTTDTNAQPDKTYYTRTEDSAAVAGSDLTVVANFVTALEATGLIEKAEAPKAETYYTEKVTKDFNEADYPAKGEFKITVNGVTETMTAQEVVSYAKKTAQDAIKKAKSDLLKVTAPATADYVTAITAYKKAYDDAKKILTENKVKTNAEIADEEADKVIDVAAAIAKLRAYAVGDYYDGAKIAVPASAKTADITGLKAIFGDKIYVEDTAAKTYAIFGVKVANPAKATVAEVKAVNAALYNAIGSAVSAAEVTLKGVAKDEVATELAKLYDASEKAVTGTTKFTVTLKNAYVVNDIYKDVVTYGEKLKNTYKFGVKWYDDVKVDAVVKAAEALVYADLGSAAPKTAEAYFLAAIKSVYGNTKDLTYLELDNTEALAKFKKAQDDAKAKFDGTVINYGENKTPEADKKYKASVYVSGTVTADDETYTDIKTEAVKAIEAAQSYADINAAMAAADAKLAQLMTTENKDTVEKLQASYYQSLQAYSLEKQAFLDMTKYAAADFTTAVTSGKALIDKAGTADGVKDAFEKAKALVDSVKSLADKVTAKEAMEAQIAALPLSSKVTLADADSIAAVRTAYDAYNKIPGIATVTATKLTAAENALAVLEKADLEAKVKAIETKISAIGTVNDDKSAEAAVALKAEAEALKASVDAFNKKVDKLKLNSGKVTATALDKFLAKDADANDNVYKAEIYLAAKAIEAIDSKVEKADPAAVKAAKEVFDKLTEKQQFILDDMGYADKLAAALANLGVQVQSLKIKASSKAVKGRITVKWKVEGTAAAADGYQVYKSTKANSGYKFMGKTTKSYMYNKKNLKKGKRYFYKVRAYVEIDGQRYYSDWSNKANRFAK